MFNQNIDMQYCKLLQSLIFGSSFNQNIDSLKTCKLLKQIKQIK